MKFITEQDVRATFIQTPFKVYHLPVDTRLTPEARQFLIDRKISITDGNDKLLPKTRILEKKQKSELELTSSLFLLSVSLAVETDPVMAENSHSSINECKRPIHSKQHKIVSRSLKIWELRCSMYCCLVARSLRF